MSLLTRFASLSRASSLATRRLSTIIAAHPGNTSAPEKPQDATNVQERPHHAVISLSGPDKAGIVNTVSSTISEHDANVEASRMALLGGDFAMILHITMKNTQISDNLGSKLREHFPDFSVTLRDTTAPAVRCEVEQPLWDFSLEGPDHPGLVSSVSQAFATNGSNVQEMNTHSEIAPFAGYELFAINGKVTVDESRLDDLSNALNAIEERFGSTITLEKCE